MGRPEDVLGYRAEGGTAAPLPGWARYLVAIGRYLACHKIDGWRLVVGISLPTRAFAGALAALGVVDAVYEDPEKRDPRENFDRLASLPPGTAIRYRRGRYLYCGRLLGVEIVDGVEHLTYHDEAKCYLPWGRCSAVEPLDPAEPFVRRRLLAPNAGFVASVLGIDPLAHASYTCLDCLVVGIKEALREEVLEQRFVACRDDAVQQGVLNDLLRCDAFELNANDHDRTAVLPAFADEIPERLQNEVPPAVVFDGPAGYLRLRTHWRESPCLVLLDRTSPSAIPAGHVFNQELALSVDDADLSALGEPPPKFEIRGYYEVIR